MYVRIYLDNFAVSFFPGFFFSFFFYRVVFFVERRNNFDILCSVALHYQKQKNEFKNYVYFLLLVFYMSVSGV